MFKRKPRRWLGLDTYSDQWVAVEMQQRGKVLTVEKVYRDIAPIPCPQDQDLTSTIATFLQQGGFVATEVAVAVPDEAVMTRVLPYEPELHHSTVEHYLTFKLEGELPYHWEVLYWDFQILPSKEILWVGVHQKVIETYVRPVQAAGLQVKVVDIVSHALERAMLHPREDLAESYFSLAYGLALHGMMGQ